MRSIALLLSFCALAGCQGDADFSGAVSGVRTLDPNPYRTVIVQIDRLVFDPKEYDAKRADDLGAKLDQLAARIGAIDDTQFMRLESLELRAMAEKARRTTPRESMDALQNNWMRIRNNLFDDQSWFARSAADLGEPDIVAPPREVTITKPPVEEPQAWDTTPVRSIDGLWIVRTMTMDGRTTFDEELVNSSWNFGDGRLTVEKNGHDTEKYVCEVIPDPPPSRLRLRRIVAEGSDKDGYAIYEFSGLRLRLAFYDGLGEAPPSFVVDPAIRKPLIVVELAHPQRISQ
jgi:uncharacterized protein (TIGR03067 family)